MIRDMGTGSRVQRACTGTPLGASARLYLPYFFFQGYYNNPQATAEVLTKDGWFMTGDMMYRDEKWNFYFVERIKLLLKYKNHQVTEQL